jgi:hypothetical protein
MMMIEVRNRDLIIPTSDEFVGVAGDNKIEVRQFVITDPKLFSFDFKLDVQQGENKNIIDLDKTVETDKIILSWVVKKEHIPNNGILYAQLRAFSDNEEIWHSKKDNFRIGGRIGATDYFPSPLPSEFEEMETRVTAIQSDVIEKAAEVEADRAEVATNTATVLEKTAEALQSAANALVSEENAHTSAVNAENSNQSAIVAMQTAVEAMADLDNKLDKTNNANVVYATNETGNQIYYPTGFFASGATIKVAASNASEKSKASADYVCNGINDRNTLNQAVGDLPSYGGSIELSEGSFNLNAYFELTKHNVTIKGQGHATNIINNTNNLLSAYADNFCIKECRVGALDIAGSQAVIENCHADEVYILGDTTMTNCYVSDTLEAVDGSLIPIGNRINTLSISGGTVLPPTAAEIRKLNVVDTITGL